MNSRSDQMLFDLCLTEQIWNRCNASLSSHVLTVKRNDPVTLSKHESTRGKGKKREMIMHLMFVESGQIV